MARTTNRTTPEELLSGYAPEIQVLAFLLRQLVKSALPEVEERVYPGWRAIGYRQAGAGYIGGIFLYPNVVKLGFESGAMLPDHHGLLKSGPSAGKKVRYVEVREEGDIKADIIREYLAAAVELQSDKQMRRRLRR